MPLLLLDLDNTLVDREAAFRRWATGYLAEHGLEPELLEPMVVADGDGLRPKPEVADDLAVLLDLDEDEESRIVKILRAGVVEHLVLVPGCADALIRAREAGWTPWIVTNGQTAQQEKKIAKLGLAELVDGWVISEEAGVVKPDPAFFTLTAERSGQPLDGAWVVGDAALTDIAGGQAAGLATAWLSRGRRWDHTQEPPTVTASSFSDAIDQVLAR